MSYDNKTLFQEASMARTSITGSADGLGLKRPKRLRIIAELIIVSYAECTGYDTFQPVVPMRPDPTVQQQAKGC
jgi:hypothetical protein